jgi:hypothetical protein
MNRLDDTRARVCTRAVAAVAPEVGIRDVAAVAALLDWDDVLRRALARGRIDPDTVRAALIDALDELANREPSLFSASTRARGLRRERALRPRQVKTRPETTRR